jgi:hypothetical protein
MLSSTLVTLFVDDVFRVPEGARQSVEFGNDEGVAVPARSQGFSQAGACSVGAGEAVVGVDQVRSNARASLALRWAVRSWSFVDTLAYPIRNSFIP